ncbi:OLC1v1008073C1 [Oldenlandia corymbosa var. corymbosa]|uniref:OLC1v1008073C1 n=1 Tax=Oldenlandia corymbosa var. corymbosa TaxID=529605 RepID=A0AAV1DN93_OLDCO|nr:OLC1v1008073C1 [Oldenlandia corymbosa var. corymbosa]
MDVKAINIDRGNDKNSEVAQKKSNVAEKEHSVELRQVDQLSDKRVTTQGTVDGSLVSVSCQDNAALNTVGGNQKTWKQVEGRGVKAESDQQQLQKLQEVLASQPGNENLQMQERRAYEKAIYSSKAALSFLKQKAKEEWLVAGDENTAFFHSKLKARNMRNRIWSIVDGEGELINNWDQLEKHFISFYKAQLGQSTKRKVAD